MAQKKNAGSELAKSHVDEEFEVEAGAAGDALANALSTIDKSKQASLLARGYELAGPMVKLAEGQGFEEVIYEGPGGEINVRNPTTHELTAMQTASFRLPKGGNFRILKDAGLTSRLPDTAIGKTVAIFKGGKSPLPGGRSVNEWLIFVKESSNGAGTPSPRA
jgi:hypothetical protein